MKKIPNSKFQNPKIGKEEVKHIAKLARLGLSEREIEKYQKELSKILDYIEKLKEIDVSNVEPTFHPLKIKNVVREDAQLKKDIDEIKKLIELMREKRRIFES
jgi:aspartyl/glutamyl-tRNA(Asn/Gln) amidotransferase subunit C (EC 6.3.5.-)